MTYKDRLDYIRKTFAPEDQVLLSVRQSITDANDQIFVTPEDGKFLQFLISLCQAKNIVEIGTLGGYSTLWMMKALTEEEDGHIHTIEKDQKRAALARENFKKFDPYKKITLLEGDALEVLPNLSGPFDMIFIDADKLNYLHYLDWAEKNVRKGGLIVADNTFLNDAVWGDAPIERIRDTARASMREFNARLADPARYQSILLATEAGMTVAVKMF